MLSLVFWCKLSVWTKTIITLFRTRPVLALLTNFKYFSALKFNGWKPVAKLASFMQILDVKENRDDILFLSCPQAYTR
jgi:hypothetical protein